MRRSIPLSFFADSQYKVAVSNCLLELSWTCGFMLARGKNHKNVKNVLFAHFLLSLLLFYRLNEQDTTVLNSTRLAFPILLSVSNQLLTTASREQYQSESTNFLSLYLYVLTKKQITTGKAKKKKLRTERKKNSLWKALFPKMVLWG